MTTSFEILKILETNYRLFNCHLNNNNDTSNTINTTNNNNIVKANFHSETRKEGKKVHHILPFLPSPLQKRIITFIDRDRKREKNRERNRESGEGNGKRVREK